MGTWWKVVGMLALASCRPVPSWPSSVEVDRQVAVADGVDAITVSVLARGADGAPLQGVSARVVLSGEQNNITPDGALTDDLGAATFLVTSTRAGTKQVVVTLDAVTVPGVPDLSFTPGPAAKLVFSKPPATTIAGQPMHDVAVTVLDLNDNVVPTATPVTLAARLTTFMGPHTAMTVDGVATFSRLIFRHAQQVILDAQSDGGLRATAAPFDVTPGAPASMTISLVTPATTVVAGTSNALFAQVQDAFGNPVPHASVALSASGTDNTFSTPAGFTDAMGSLLSDYASTKAEQKVLTAQTGPMEVTLDLEVTAARVDPSRAQLTVAPSTLSANGLDTATVTLRLFDGFGNPCPHEASGVTASTALTIFPPSWVTDLEGRADFQARSTTPGVFTITASENAQPLLATATVTFVQPVHHLVAYVQGLTGGDLVLSSPGQPDLTIPVGAERGEFATALTAGQGYDVSVKSQPTGLACHVFGGQDVAVASNAFVRVSCATKWKAVADGAVDSVGVRDDGTFWFWNLSTPASVYRLDASTDWVSPGYAGGNFAGLRSNGTLWLWSRWTQTFFQFGTDSDWAAFANGGELVAQKRDGSLWWVETVDSSNLPTSPTMVPVRVGAPGDLWASFSIGSLSAGPFPSYAAAIKADGTLWLWDHLNPDPVQLGLDTDWATLSAGNQHLLLVKRDGSAWLSTVSAASSAALPQRLGSATGWSKVSANREVAAGQFDLLQKNDGTLWGLDVSSPLTPPSPLSADTDWSAFDQTSALKSDGSRWWAWQLSNPVNGMTLPPSVMPSNHGFVAVAAGGSHSAAIGFDGTAFSWGGDSLFVPTPAVPTAVRGAVRTSSSGSAAISTDGTLMTSTSPAFNDFSSSLTGSWVSVAQGASTYALRNDATLWSISTGQQLLPGTRWKSVSTDQAGGYAALNEDGSSWSWQDPTPIQPTLPTRSSPALDWAVVIGPASGIRLDGTFWANGVQLGPDTDWLSGATEGVVFPSYFGTIFQTFGIKRDGSLWHGDQSGWTRVGSSTDWTAVAPGDSHVLALRSDGSLWAWGLDEGGRLGEGPRTAFGLLP